MTEADNSPQIVVHPKRWLSVGAQDIVDVSPKKNLVTHNLQTIKDLGHFSTDIRHQITIFCVLQRFTTRWVVVA